MPANATMATRRVGRDGLSALGLGCTGVSEFTNEQLVGHAIAGRGDDVVLATKFGNERRADGSRVGVNGRLESVRQETAAEKPCSPGQPTIAWLLAQGDGLVPIPGTKRRCHLEENPGADDVEVTPDHLAPLDEAARGAQPPATARPT